MTARTFSSIKTASRLVNGFAAAAIAFAPTLSFGQDLKATPVASSSDGITTTTDCDKWKPGVLMSDEKCEIIKGEFLRAQGKALSSQSNQIATQNGCIEAIVRFKKAEPDQFASLGLGTITRDNACKLVSRLPKKSASLQ
jgi:hypothetical protein